MKIRVDVMPKNCSECLFRDYMLNSKCKIAHDLKEYDSKNMSKCRRHDCPLIDDNNEIGGQSDEDLG